MADKGPLVRVNTYRDVVIKMTAKKAAEYVKTHPGAKIVPSRTAAGEPVHPFSADSDDAVATAAPEPDAKPTKGTSKS